MKLRKWVIGIGILIVFFIITLYVANYKNDSDYIAEQCNEISHLLFFAEQSRNDTIFVCDFNDLYRSLFISKINDSIISFCNLTDEGHNYMLIISPDSIHIFESPDLNANIIMLGLIIEHEGYTDETNLMFRKINQELDLIFKQDKIRFYRFIGFSKEKSNRVIFIDNFNNAFRSGGFCYTRTVKNSIFNPEKWKFVNDRLGPKDRSWRFPFPDNEVPEDSILPRILRVRTCKDTINRRLMNVE